MADNHYSWPAATSIATDGKHVFWLSDGRLFQGDTDLKVCRCWPESPVERASFAWDGGRMFLLGEYAIYEVNDSSIRLHHRWPQRMSRSFMVDHLCFSRGAGPRMFYFDTVAELEETYTMPAAKQIVGLDAIVDGEAIEVALAADSGALQVWAYSLEAPV